MESYLTPRNSAFQAAAPESPRPFSVISESYQHEIVLPHYPDNSIYSFGAVYEEKLLGFIHRFLELGTDDRFCYVGDSKGSLAALIQEHFCLLEKVLHVIPGRPSDICMKEGETLPVPVAYTGAEEYFRGVTQHPENMPLFDRVLLKDCVQYFNEPKQVYKSVMKTLSSFGKMMIIQRPHNVNTLPVFTDAKRRFAEIEDPYISIIKDLQNCGFDIQWEIECIPVVMPKTKWLKMLENRFPPQMQMMSAKETKNGLRELSEGMLKYGGEMVEFQDRLLFVTASWPLVATGVTSMGRIDASKKIPRQPENLRYNMKVSDDIAQYIKERFAKRPPPVYRQR